MDNKENSFNFAIVLTFILSVLCFIVIKYHWNRRWLYYHASKIPGPFAFPIIGSAHLFLGGHQELSQTMGEIIKSQPPIFKVWLGPELVIFTSRPHDLETILSKCTERGKFMEFGKCLLGEGLLSSRALKWKRSRKSINPTFSTQILHSCIGDFNKHSTRLIQKLQNYCQLDSFDVLLSIFCCLVDTACESLLDIDASLVNGQENYVNNCIKVEQLAYVRAMKLWCHSDFIWNRSSEGKEMDTTARKVFDFIKKIIDMNKSSKKNCNGNSEQKKRFLNHLLDLSDSHFDDQLILEETQTMILTASETTALTISTLLVVLGIFPQVQEKIYDELVEVFGKDNREPTLEDLNKMVYLEAVIKETMRLFPTIPLTLREITEDVQLDGYTIPAGCNVVIPIKVVHTLSEYWTDPDQFNPERFLNKEEANLPKCAYMPFSYGPRNCIGSRFAMLSMKSLLSRLLKHYKIESIGYKSVEEFEFVYHGAIELKDGYKIKISER